MVSRNSPHISSSSLRGSILLLLAVASRQDIVVVAFSARSSRSVAPKCRSQRASLLPLALSDSSENSSASTSTSKVPHVSWGEVSLPHPPEDLIMLSTVSVTTDEITKQDKLALVAVASASVLGMSALISISGPGSWRYYLAGGICAAASHTIPVPIDVVKTRKQVDPTLEDKDFLEVTKYIIANEGMRSLLAGLGPTVVGYLFEGAIKFGVYETTKPLLKGLLRTVAQVVPGLAFLNSQIMAFILSGATSGMAAAAVLSPMEALRIRLVAEPDYAPGWIQGGYKMVEEDGVGFLTKGLRPMMYKQVPYTVVKNVSFDTIAKSLHRLLRNNGIGPTATVKFTVPLVAAAAASVLSCISSQPGDMLLTLINAHGGKRRTRDIVRDILRSDKGVGGFFVGFKTRLLHVGLIVTLQLLLYDIIKRLCGIGATGL